MLWSAWNYIELEKHFWMINAWKWNLIKWCVNRTLNEFILQNLNCFCYECYVVVQFQLNKVYLKYLKWVKNVVWFRISWFLLSCYSIKLPKLLNSNIFREYFKVYALTFAIKTQLFEFVVAESLAVENGREREREKIVAEYCFDTNWMQTNYSECISGRLRCKSFRKLISLHV